MNGQLQSELPFWLASIGLVLAIFLSWYAYAGKKNAELFTKFQRIFLGSIRGIGIFVVVILLIGIYFKSVNQSKMDPAYLVAFDNSESMLLGSDSSKLFSACNNIKHEIINELGSEFLLDTFQFGNSLENLSTPNFDQPVTNFDQSFRQLILDYSNRPVKELLIITDGIPTSGHELRSVLSRWPHPVSIIASGDTLINEDTRIEDIIFNDIAFHNSVFPVDFIINSENTAEKSLVLNISLKGEIIIDTVVMLDPFDGRAALKLLIPAEAPGVNVYESFLVPITGEQNVINNRRPFVVEVIEKKNKVLLAYNQPHPDIAVFSEIINNTGDYELDIWPVDQGRPELDDYATIILYQLPGNNTEKQGLLQAVFESDISTFIIAGSQTSLEKLNEYIPDITFSSDRTLYEDYTPNLNSQFDLFHLPYNIEEYLKILPPLKGHFSRIGLGVQSYSLFNQTVKGVELEEPMLWFSRSGAKKLGFLWGEGLWRWNTYEYLYFDDHYYTESLIRSVLGYLSVNDVNDPLKVDVPVALSSYETINWNARLYNESFELTVEPVLYMDIKNPLGEFRKYEFRKNNDMYWMRLDNLIGGTYEYTCYTNLSGKEVSKSGTVEVLEIPYEGLDIKSRLIELQVIAEQKGGQFFRIDETDNINSYLKTLKADDSSNYLESNWINLLDWHFLLFFLVGIFALEWILRRFLGTR